MRFLSIVEVKSDILKAVQTKESKRICTPRFLVEFEFTAYAPEGVNEQKVSQILNFEKELLCSLSAKELNDHIYLLAVNDEKIISENLDECLLNMNDYLGYLSELQLLRDNDSNYYLQPSKDESKNILVYEDATRELRYRLLETLSNDQEESTALAMGLDNLFGNGHSEVVYAIEKAFGIRINPIILKQASRFGLTDEKQVYVGAVLTSV